MAICGLLQAKSQNEEFLSVRNNQSLFTAKALRNAIMTRSRLENIYNKKSSYDNWDKQT